MPYLVILVLFFWNSFSLSAQSNDNFWQRHILGVGTETPAQLSIDCYPFLFLSKGGGGSIGYEFDHFQVGLIGFSVEPPPFIISTFFDKTEGITMPRNNAVEAFVKYYLRPDRQWLYVGLLGGPEWFVVEDKASKAKEVLVKTYLVPVVGVRWLPFKKYFYMDASIGYSFNLGGTALRELGTTSYQARRGGLIYFFQLGVRVNI